jgi:hypothetical protein
MCSCTKKCDCEKKIFTSDLNYDGPKVPCIDPLGTICPPYSSFNDYLNIITEKVCEILALGGVPGAQGIQGVQGDPGPNIVWIPTASPTIVINSGTVTSVELFKTISYSKIGKTFFFNIDVQLSLTGFLANIANFTIDFTSVLGGDTFSSGSSVVQFYPNANSQIYRATSGLNAGTGLSTGVINFVQLPKNSTAETYSIISQGFFILN